MPERWLTVLLRITPSKSPGADLAALAIDPVAMRSAKRAACPKGADRSISNTWRWYLRAIAAVVLTARVVTPEPPLAEKKATTGAAVRDQRWTSTASTADSSCSHSRSRAAATVSAAGPRPSRSPSRSRVKRTASVTP